LSAVGDLAFAFQTEAARIISIIVGRWRLGVCLSDRSGEAGAPSGHNLPRIQYLANDTNSKLEFNF